jgi:hypothetical protein
MMRRIPPYDLIDIFETRADSIGDQLDGSILGLARGGAWTRR